MEPEVTTDDSVESESDGSDMESDGSNITSLMLSRQVSKCSAEVYRYEVLSTERLVDKMEANINDINKLMDPPIPKSTVMALLDHFKWDKARFLERYFDDYDNLFKEANISKPKSAKEKQTNNQMKKLRSEDEILCEICFTEERKLSITCLDECGHMYCNECWKSYLNCKVQILETYIFPRGYVCGTIYTKLFIL